LLTGTDNNLLPVGDALFHPICRNSKVDAIAIERGDSTDTQLGGLLYGPVKSIAFAQAKAQRGVNTRLGIGRGGCSYLERHGLFINTGDRRCKLVAVAIEQADGISDACTKCAPKVFCSTPFQ
jgi:hypothetical protein